VCIPRKQKEFEKYNCTNFAVAREMHVP